MLMFFKTGQHGSGDDSSQREGDDIDVFESSKLR